MSKKMNGRGQTIWLGACILWLVMTVYFCVAEATSLYSEATWLYRTLPFFIEYITLRISGIALIASCFASGPLSYILFAVVFVLQWVFLLVVGRFVIALWPGLPRTKRCLAPALLVAFFAASTWLNHFLVIALED